jgi:uncharacterized repeat protein (TIGR02543 family)
LNDGIYEVLSNGRTLDGKELVNEKDTGAIVWKRYGTSSAYKYDRVDVVVQEPGKYLYRNNITVTYLGNGGTGTGKTDTKTYNSSYTVWDNTGTGSFSKTGYTVGKWNTKADGSGTNVSKSATVNPLTDDLELYAQWSPNTYTVQFNNNGGTGSQSSITCTYDAVTEMPGCDFTRSGWIFLGWSTSSSGPVQYYANSEYTLNLTPTQGGTVTLYAIWY